MLRALLLLVVCLASPGCAHRPDGLTGYLVPETVQVGITAPNLLNGPVASTKSGESRRDPTGQLGLMVSGTWRLVPIRIERSEPQPAYVVPSPTPLPSFRPGTDRQVPMPAPPPKL